MQTVALPLAPDESVIDEVNVKIMCRPIIGTDKRHDISETLTG